MSFLLLVAVLSVVYLVVAKLERTAALQFRPLPSPRPYLPTDIAWYGIAVGATAMSVFALRPILSRLSIRPVARTINHLPLIAKLAIALVVFDFVSFTVHRCLHRYDLLWNVHKVHHSSLHLDGFATTRTHMIENMLRFVPGQAVLFLVGMPATVVAPAVAIAGLYGVFNHSNLGIDLRWVEAVLVTPRLHRRHHVPSTTQNNYGVMLTLWDRLGGTLVRRETGPDERYGVPDEIDTYPQRFLPAFRRPFEELRARTRPSAVQHRGISSHGRGQRAAEQRL
jgi:sterol desaturase/sphingolipid hydroxylase (fatty acid hydroxylase superfamily)